MTKPSPLIGVQVGAHSVFDEGVDFCLDLLQETTQANTIFVYSHTYQQFANSRSLEALADHGRPVRDPATRVLPYTWVTPDETYYADTILRHSFGPPDSEYRGKDVLAALAEPVHERDMKLYARVLEGSDSELARYIPNWIKTTTVDVYGRVHHLPCWNNPHYRRWWLSTVEDLFKSYDLDGFQFGSERVGPLSNVLFKGQVPVCFCDHCRAKGYQQNIQVERAREGFRKLYEFVQGLQQPMTPPVDGVMVSVMRLLLKYPEILSWARLWRTAREEVASQIYGVVKAIKPDAEVGLHIDHQQSTWDPLFRAEMGYDEMIPYCDFIKPILYHDIAGPRIRRWYLDRVQQTIGREFPLDQSLEMFYALRGYDPQEEPALDALDHQGFSAEYVYRETLRCKQSVGNQAAVYAGIGMDVPWNKERFPTHPDTVYDAVVRAFEAGADGIVVSREYDEMQLENLKAVGRAIQSVQA